MPPRQSKLKCFVASAFGHEDIDTIFDEAIEPVLDKLNVTPLRVDRVEHNDDIDDKIFELLNQAHFCLADLTWARPSVYYEAGYAFGQGKPVVYIARNDHFVDHKDDPAGNRRIHFDLKMKNTIKWTAPNNTFKEALRKRVRKVIQPLLKQRQEESEAARRKSAFASLPQKDQLDGIRRATDVILDSRRFQRDGQSIPNSTTAWHRLREGVYERVEYFAGSSIKKADVNQFKYFLFDTLNHYQKRPNVRSYQCCLVLAALRSLNKTTTAGWFPSHEQPFPGIFRRKVAAKTKKDALNSVIVIDGIKTVADFSSRLEVALATIGID